MDEPAIGIPPWRDRSSDPARPARLLPAYDSGDHVHPNDAGYELIAQTFFEAIAHGRSTPAAAAAPEIFARSPR